MIFFVCVSDKIPAKFCHAAATVNLHNTLCSDPSLLRSLCRREAGEKEKESPQGMMGRRRWRRFPLPIVPRGLSITMSIWSFCWGLL